MSTRRVAIVTGAGSGIGRAIATRLAGGRAGRRRPGPEHRAAADAVAHELSERGLDAVAIGGVDVSDRAQVVAAVERVRAEVGPPLVLVNNAGITGFKQFLAITDEKWDRMMEVNLNGPFYCTQAVVPDMIEAGWGRIVNISSSSAQSGQPYMVHYVTSKAGLIGFTKAVALELAPQGITVNTIPPGLHRHAHAAGLGGAGPARRHVGGPRRAHAGAPRRPARGHRLRVLVPRLRGGQLRHRAGHRGQRRPQHLIARGPGQPHPWTDGQPRVNFILPSR